MDKYLLVCSLSGMKIWKGRSALISKSQFFIVSIFHLLGWEGEEMSLNFSFDCMGGKGISGEKMSLLFWAFGAWVRKFFPFPPFIWMGVPETPFIIYWYMMQTYVVWFGCAFQTDMEWTYKVPVGHQKNTNLSPCLYASSSRSVRCALR